MWNMEYTATQLKVFTDGGQDNGRNVWEIKFIENTIHVFSFKKHEPKKCKKLSHINNAK